MVAASKDIPSMISQSVDIIQGGFFGNSKSSFNQSLGKPKKQDLKSKYHDTKNNYFPCNKK